MGFVHKLVLAIALISCLAVSMPADSIVPEEDHVPETTLPVLDQVRHLPADDIVAFLQRDESSCRSVAGSLQTEVKKLISADETAYGALDTGVNCPNELQSNTDTFQTAYNSAKAAVKSAEDAKAAADSAPVTMTITLKKSPSLSTFTSHSAWQKAVTAAKNAEDTLKKRQGELKQAKTALETAKSAQAKAVLACQCKAKKAFGAAVSNAKKHETSSREDWRKSERLLCALKKQESCPSNFPGFAKPPALPQAVSSKTKAQCRPPAPPPPPPRPPCSCSNHGAGGYHRAFSKVTPTHCQVHWGRNGYVACPPAPSNPWKNGVYHQSCNNQGVTGCCNRACAPGTGPKPR